MSALEILRDGAEHHRGLAVSALEDLLELFPERSVRPGRRIQDIGRIAGLVGPGSAIARLAAATIGTAARPVRAMTFDKADGANWSLGWHQDRVIAVQERRDVSDFGPWTLKDGQHHVQPPADLLARMATVRIHLDAVDLDNAPLKIAPGSHRWGRIAERDIASVVERCGEATCLAERGDVWIYATLVLHASDRASPGRRRRVVQIDYSADTLPGGLRWQLA